MVVLCNLKPRNMRGVKSNGMVLCASSDAHDRVEPLAPPPEATVGERVWFGEDGKGQVRSSCWLGCVVGAVGGCARGPGARGLLVARACVCVDVEGGGGCSGGKGTHIRGRTHQPHPPLAHHAHTCARRRRPRSPTACRRRSCGRRCSRCSRRTPPQRPRSAASPCSRARGPSPRPPSRARASPSCCWCSGAPWEAAASSSSSGGGLA